MGIEKQSSKGGNYVGGFLQMFDWNAKSRKKLFSSKSDVPEQSKQKKRCDGNLPTTRMQMLEADETTAGSSIKEGSDYSCSSSLVDEDLYGMRAPGVIARLMGLDSLPKSAPFIDSRSLREPNYHHETKSVEHYRDRFPKSGSLHDVPVRKAMEKFRTEMLPPKSAKSIPITHHKLLSPVKSAYFTPSKDPARVMEAAARIIEPRRQAGSERAKLPPVGSSSVPLRVEDFKEKARSARKPPTVSEGSQRKAERSAVNVRSNGKSVSLALQAKANVQKREGIINADNTSRSPVRQKEPNELSPNNLFKSQPTAQRNKSKKPCTQTGPNVLRQNNQKQNCIIDRGKSPNKCNSKKISSRKLGSEAKDDGKSKVMSSSSSEGITRKKRSVDGNYHHAEKSQPVKNAKGVRSFNGVTDRPISWDQDRGRTGTDVVSFTFNAPMTRGGHGSVGPAERKVFPADSSRFSYLGHDMKGGDALSTLLEQKLKELAEKVELSRQESGSVVHDMEITSSTVLEGNEATDEMEIDDQGVLEEMSMCGSIVSRGNKLLDCRFPSPVSVLELSPFAESCNSSDTVDSNCMGDIKQRSSVQAQELLDTYSSKMSLTIEGGDAELSVSSSSNPSGKSRIEYVRAMLSDIEQMYDDFATGRTHAIVKSHLFDRLELPKGYLSNFGGVLRTDSRLMFDCVSECLDSRCRRYVSGGCKLWAKGLSVIRRKERLAEEVLKEVSGWSSVGDSTTDGLVDKDMSSQYGKWVDFDVEAFELGVQIESRIFSSLIDDAVADILVL